MIANLRWTLPAFVRPLFDLEFPTVVVTAFVLRLLICCDLLGGVIVVAADMPVERYSVVLSRCSTYTPHFNPPTYITFN